jgi:hypothetical protein
MSGGSGGPIIIHHARKALTDPIVHGELPAITQAAVDTVMAKEDADWTDSDKMYVGNAFKWCLCNLK